MDEYNIIERAQQVSRTIINAIPSINSCMSAQVSSIMEEIKYKQEKVTYRKNQDSNQFEEVDRQPYKNENNEDILQVIYLPLVIESNNVSTFENLSKTEDEFNKAKTLGFKGNIKEYLSKRDYT